MHPVYKYALAFMLIIVGLEFIVFKFVKDKKTRYILLCLLGVITMSTILIGTIIAKMRNATIYMSVLLIGYLLSLSYMWFKWIRKKWRTKQRANSKKNLKKWWKKESKNSVILMIRIKNSWRNIRSIFGVLFFRQRFFLF